MVTEPIRLRVDVEELTKDLPSVLGDIKKQLPYAIAVALTRVASTAKKRIVGAMPTVFDRPTRYALNSLYMKAATKQTLEATIWVKDAWDKGVPPVNFISPNVFGGGRSMKKHERALRIKGLLPSGYSIVPGKSAKLDQYGNQRASQIVQVLSSLKAFGQQGYYANRTKASSKRNKKPRDFFVGTIKQRFGVFERVSNKKVRSVMAFVQKEPKYRRDRLPFTRIAEHTLSERIGPEFGISLKQAMDTANTKSAKRFSSRPSARG